MSKLARRFITTLVMSVVLVVVGIALGLLLTRTDIVTENPLTAWILGPDREARTDTGTTVVEGIRDLDQLATVQWTESVPVTQESGGNRLERIFNGESVLLIAVGQVQAGVDLSEIEAEDVTVDEEADSVTIDLPDPEILSASLEERRTEVYDRDFSPLNIRPDDELVDQAREAAVERIEISARENGILEQAERNAEDSLGAFVRTLGFDSVTFE